MVIARMPDTALPLRANVFEGRQAPWSEEAELSVLGAMLIDPRAIGDVVLVNSAQAVDLEA